jgi:hypothetical protein
LHGRFWQQLLGEAPMQIQWEKVLAVAADLPSLAYGARNLQIAR